MSDEYVIVFNEDASSSETAAVKDYVRGNGGVIHFEYGTVINGIAVRLSENQVRGLLNNPHIRSIEENAVIETATTQYTSSFQPFPSSDREPTTNPSDLWYLDRLDDTTASGDGTFEYCSTGTGVRVYVVDTGVRGAHSEFQKSSGGSKVVSPGSGFPQLAGTPCWGNSMSGSNEWHALAGHGTAVASLIAGNTFGTAKDVTIVDARAVKCRYNDQDPTTAADIVEVLDWIPNDPDKGSARQVVNMSFEFYVYSTGGYALEDAVNAMDAGGIFMVSAAGNADASAWWTVPARATGSITAGGTNRNQDTRWHYVEVNDPADPSDDEVIGSNFGNEIKVWAPAQHIESAHHMLASEFGWLNGRDSHRSIADDCDEYVDTCNSGTSFAAPIVAGVVARYLQSVNPTGTRQTLLNYIDSEASVSLTEGGVTRPFIHMSDCN